MLHLFRLQVWDKYWLTSVFFVHLCLLWMLLNCWPLHFAGSVFSAVNATRHSRRKVWTSIIGRAAPCWNAAPTANRRVWSSMVMSKNRKEQRLQQYLNSVKTPAKFWAVIHVAFEISRQKCPKRYQFPIFVSCKCIAVLKHMYWWTYIHLPICIQHPPTHPPSTDIGAIYTSKTVRVERRRSVG